MGIGPEIAVRAGMRRARCVPLAILAAVLLLPGGASAQAPFTSAEGGYTISFPAAPKETVETKPEGKISSYIVRHDNGVYGTSHAEYKSDLDVEAELQANAVNFADAVKAPLTSRRRTQFSAASGERLPELEFTYKATSSPARAS